ncbi:MAG: hypothetical protein SFU91_06625 [Chloroherpetonaceae bacterium]|nr:hypothetical protein [Chloroherpetonaceae bacterium]
MKPIFYFLAAGLSIVLSIYLFFFGQSQNHESIAIFIGLWAPTILAIGIYNELINIYQEIAEKKKSP